MPSAPENIDATMRQIRLELDRDVPAFDAAGRRLPQFDRNGLVILPPDSECQMCPGAGAHVHHWTVTCPGCGRQEVVKGPGSYRFTVHPRLGATSGPCPSTGATVGAALVTSHLLGGAHQKAV